MKNLAIVLSMLVLTFSLASFALAAHAENKTISTTLTTTTNGSLPTPAVNNNTIVNDTNQLDDSNIPPITNNTTVQ